MHRRPGCTAAHGLPSKRRAGSRDHPDAFGKDLTDCDTNQPRASKRRISRSPRAQRNDGDVQGRSMIAPTCGTRREAFDRLCVGGGQAHAPWLAVAHRRPPSLCERPDQGDGTEVTLTRPSIRGRPERCLLALRARAHKEYHIAAADYQRRWTVWLHVQAMRIPLCST